MAVNEWTKHYLMQMVNGRYNLSEYLAGVFLGQSATATDVIVQFTSVCILHHYDYLLSILEHCKTRMRTLVRECISALPAMR